jgi:dTDP-glucose 4,6-dehydratase
MRVLITGSEGVLGSVLKKELRDRGHDVYGCDLFHSCDPKIIRADVGERRQIARAFDFSKPDFVYHLAAEFGRNNGQEYYEQLWKTNCIGTRNVIEECIRTKAVLAHASSSEAYGLAELYTSWDLHEDLLDEFPPQFHNEYALTKWTNERQVTMAVRNGKLSAAIFRFFNVYGPPERFSPYRSVVCQLAYKLLKGLPVTITKDGFRSHLWIGDWVKPVANLAERFWDLDGSKIKSKVFNIGGDEYTSIEELYNRLVAIIQPVSPKVTFIKTEANNCATKKPNNYRSKFLLDHDPSTSLDFGLKQTVSFLRSQYGF